MDAMDSPCSITRTLAVVGERWTFLVLREAFFGRTRFSEFRAALGIAPDVLTDRLGTLVEYGVMARVPYQDEGARTRYAYEITDAGRELQVVLGALQQWGDEHLPWHEGPSVVRRRAGTRRALHVAFVDGRGSEVPLDDVEFVPTAAYPT